MWRIFCLDWNPWELSHSITSVLHNVCVYKTAKITIMKLVSNKKSTKYNNPWIFQLYLPYLSKNKKSKTFDRRILLIWEKYWSKDGMSFAQTEKLFLSFFILFKIVYFTASFAEVTPMQSLWDEYHFFNVFF